MLGFYCALEILSYLWEDSSLRMYHQTKYMDKNLHFTTEKYKEYMGEVEQV